MRICADCFFHYCGKDPAGSDWVCAASTELQINPVTGKLFNPFCSVKNPIGTCKDFYATTVYDEKRKANREQALQAGIGERENEILTSS